MISLLSRAWLRLSLWLLAVVRRVFLSEKRLYMLLNLGPIQPHLARIGRMRARAVFLKAANRCPAYGEFLRQEGYATQAKWDLALVPITTKENYVKRYSLEQRCYGGAIPLSGVVIDESSGSTGQPNNWVRSAAERDDVKRILQMNYELIYSDSGIVLLNCFALGPWATGMNVSLSLVDVGIMKSIGPDRLKLENTLKLLGPKYRYLIFGYPPFLRSFVDETQMDLSGFHMDFVVGGEGMSEGLRAHLLKAAKTVTSSYGASDLEINIGIETELTIAVRRRCLENGEMSRALFGRDTPPMIFQYNAGNYVIETNENNELIFTIARVTAAAPKIRYNLRDAGGVYSFRQLAERLETFGIQLSSLSSRFSHFPLLYVYGRNDASVPFYGCKVFPSDLEQIINSDKTLEAGISSFQLRGVEDKTLMSYLEVHLEKRRDTETALPAEEQLHEVIFAGLMRVNQDFREVTRMFQRSQVRVIVHEHGSGPFAGRDIRIKYAYIAP